MSWMVGLLVFSLMEGADLCCPIAEGREEEKRWNGKSSPHPSIFSRSGRKIDWIGCLSLTALPQAAWGAACCSLFAPFNSFIQSFHSAIELPQEQRRSLWIVLLFMNWWVGLLTFALPWRSHWRCSAHNRASNSSSQPNSSHHSQHSAPNNSANFQFAVWLGAASAAANQINLFFPLGREEKN